MAYAGTVSGAYHGTAGTVADVVNLSRRTNSLRISNRGSVDIYYTLGVETAAAPTPVAAADNTYIVAAGKDLVENSTNQITSVALIATAASVYSVEARH